MAELDPYVSESAAKVGGDPITALIKAADALHGCGTGSKSQQALDAYWKIGEALVALHGSPFMFEGHWRAGGMAHADGVKPSPYPTITATLRDAHGGEVETLEGPAPMVALRALQFIIAHATDPDENGAAAAPGSVEFAPLEG